jgi:predicted permease
MRELAHSLKAIARSPIFTCIFVLALAAGIGAALSVFTVVDALLLRPLSLPHPEQLLGLSGSYRGHSKVPFSYPMFAELERRQRVFRGLCGWTPGQDFTVEINQTASLSNVRSVTSNCYSVLGARPLLGRLISADDAQGSQVSQVAVIGYQLWKERFAGDPNVVGRTLHIDGKLFTIIGVTGKWFTGLTVGSPPEITIPAGAGQLFHLESRHLLWLLVTGRLATGDTIEHASAQLQAVWPRVLEATVPTGSAGERRQSFLSMGLQIASVANGADTNGDLRSRAQTPLFLLMGVVSLILLVICVNLASLTLARAGSRRHEIGTRIALGARPWQAVRQFMAETLILSATGSLLALCFSSWGSEFLIRLATRGETVPALLDIRPDWRIFFFTIAAAVFTGSLTGLLPVWQLLRQRPGSTLRENARTMSGGMASLNKALIISQVAISLIVLQTAGLFLRTLESLKAFDPGFNKVGVTELDLSPVPHGYDGIDMESYRKQLAEAVEGLPSVRSAGFTDQAILAVNYGWKDTVGRSTATNPDDTVAASRIAITPGFFQTLGIPLLAGRDFAWADDIHHPHVAIIDKLLAGRLFGSENPIGKRIRFGVQPDSQDLQIIGISQSARLQDIRDGDAAYIFVPSSQYGFSKDGGTLLVRGTANPDFGRTIEQEVRSLGREYSSRTSTLAQTMDISLVNEQLTASLSTFFAVIAVLVAGFGLFGLLTYSVILRTREIGVRMALGSQRTGILKLVLKEAIQITLIGISVGLPCAIGVSRLFAHMLFATSFADPATLTTASLTLLLTGAVGGLFPAVKAMKLEPAEALRRE